MIAWGCLVRGSRRSLYALVGDYGVAGDDILVALIWLHHSRRSVLARTDSDSQDDPWLTLAEIAEELRVNPATVRLWIARGRLTAMRPGQRKLLVRRSELDRMLRDADVPGASVDGPSAPVEVGRSSGGSFPTAGVGVVGRAADRVVAGGMREAVEAVRAADVLWTAALDASADPPPDPGFGSRVRALADAAGREAAALERAAGARLGWKPVDHGPGPLTLSHELRAGANRPGPVELWARFDAAAQSLGDAMRQTDVQLVAQAFGRLGEVMHEIADHLEADLVSRERLAG